MGRERVHFEIHASVSRHNSEDDIADDAAWDELIARIKTIMREHRYEKIRPDW